MASDLGLLGQEWLSANKDKPWKKYDDADHKIEIDDPADKCGPPPR